MDTPLTADRYLFVYGTLLPASAGDMGRDERARLGREAKWLGPATVSGTLYNLGGYPGLFDGAGIVHGGLYDLHDPLATFLWLDAYEAVTGDPTQDDYWRTQRAVTPAAGNCRSAWIYVGVRQPRSGDIIRSGSWLER
jgi:gamma-glutamylcyclotransferase (GGCT)/AIG2-like uncharacterized protein YtfP